MKTIRLLLFAALAVGGCRQQVNWNPDPTWDHTPITFDTTAMGPVFESSFRSSFAAWNFAARCRVAVQVTRGADVVVSPYDGTACGATANLEATGDATAGTWRCSPTYAEIKFQKMTDIRSVFIIAEHEEGHVFGLAHDRSALMMASPSLYEPQSIGQPHPINESPALLPLPSDADGAAVGKRYCQ